MKTLTEDEAIALIEHATDGQPFKIIELTTQYSVEGDSYFARIECHSFVQSFPSNEGSVTICGVFPDEGIVDLQIEALKDLE